MQLDSTDAAKWHILIISEKVFLSYPKWTHAFVLPWKNIMVSLLIGGFPR